MKKLLMLVFGLTATVGFAEDKAEAKDAKPVSAKELQAALQEQVNYIYLLTGGEVERPNSGEGTVVYVNAQKRVPKEWIAANAAYFRDKSRYNVIVEDGTFDLNSPKVHGKASIFVVDDPKLPMTLLASEEHWVMVNVAKIVCEKPQFFRARAGKLLSRGFCFVLGATDSQYMLAATGCMNKAEDLDAVPDYRVPVDLVARFKRYGRAMGLKPFEVATYRQACKDGWAPSPTNDVQKDIWDEVKDPKKRFEKDLPDLKKSGK